MTRQQLPVLNQQPNRSSPTGDGGDSSLLAIAARRFRALGDETRLAILEQLRACEEVCACDFLSCCAVSQPTLSHHLKVLRDAGLVTSEKRGIWVYYRLDPAAFAELRQILR